MLGFRDWLESAASWLCLTSNAFAPEIREALVLEQPLMPSHLSGDQRDRSQRVYFLTKQAFAGYSRVMSILELLDAEAPGGNQGYELLRRLGREF